MWRKVEAYRDGELRGRSASGEVREKKNRDRSHLVLFGVLEELADVIAGQNASLISKFLDKVRIDERAFYLLGRCRECPWWRLETKRAVGRLGLGNPATGARLGETRDMTRVRVTRKDSQRC